MMMMTYVLTVPKCYGRMDGQTDDMQSHNRAVCNTAVKTICTALDDDELMMMMIITRTVFMVLSS